MKEDKDAKKRVKWLEGAMDVLAGGLFGEAYKARKKQKKKIERANNPT